MVSCQGSNHMHASLARELTTSQPVLLLLLLYLYAFKYVTYLVTSYLTVALALLIFPSVTYC